MNKRVSERTQTQLAFGAAVILLVVSALAAYATVARLRIAERWVGHTRDVQNAPGRPEQHQRPGGTGTHPVCRYRRQRSFEEYQSAAADIPPKMKLIERLLADNPEQPEF